MPPRRALYTTTPNTPIILPPRHAIDPPELRSCDWCHISSRQLKRCAACNTSIYCSRECQKAAWHLHKTSCKSFSNVKSEYGPAAEDLTLAQLRALGFSSLLGFTEAFSDFQDAHSWTLANIALAAVRGDGPLDWLQAPESEHTKAVRVHLIARSPSERRRTHRDPGSAFWVKGVGFVEDSKFLDEMRKHRSDLPLPSKLEASQDPGYIGAAFVVYDIEGVTMKMSKTFAQYWPTAPELAGPEEQKAIFDDMLMLCIGCINMRCPLRILEGNDPIVALPGRFSRVEGKWTWKPLFTDWQNYRGGDRGLDEVLGRLKHHIPPRDLMTAISRL
ncbi:hypothetical protein L227DRAFT_576509 [Lentinus tigrinus ALCF2SS1-6]|uniref:MYND-type domain-containing protein n=1 Tax=Lentinus tigrinus ALCF2SS1-6 TaxID=1328759 RepID=A0A5C2S876_9APHY|nr:hypothetical protein L227DRAFT_576509 [Lentinus tigrinus ALCF2SS1-6]